MDKEQLIKLVIDTYKNMPFGVDKKEYLLKSVQLQLPVLDDNYPGLEKQLIEIVENIDDIINVNSLNATQSGKIDFGHEIEGKNTSSDTVQFDSLMLNLQDGLLSISQSLESLLTEFGIRMEKEFIIRVLQTLLENRIIVDQNELLTILRKENRNNNNSIIEDYNNIVVAAVNNDPIMSLNNVSQAKKEIFSDRVITKKCDNYGDVLYDRIVEHIRDMNIRNPQFRENYYNILKQLRHSINKYAQIYVSVMPEEIKKIDKDVESLLNQTMFAINNVAKENVPEENIEYIEDNAAKFL